MSWTIWTCIITIRTPIMIIGTSYTCSISITFITFRITFLITFWSKINIIFTIRSFIFTYSIYITFIIWTITTYICTMLSEIRFTLTFSTSSIFFTFFTCSIFLAWIYTHISIICLILAITINITFSIIFITCIFRTKSTFILAGRTPVFIIFAFYTGFISITF